MPKKKLLTGKKILIVDDEPDILETLSELLPMCEIETASSFAEAEDALQNRFFDLTILDIMGVRGYDLLEIAKEKKVTAVMLTAHALSVEDTKKSFEKGASFFIPKDEIANIADFLVDILDAKTKGKSTWSKWLDRLEWYYHNRFGPNWKESDKEFWGQIMNGKDPKNFK